MPDSVMQTLRDFITAEFGVMYPDIDITPDTHLLDTGVLDSLNLFLLFTFMEEQFGVVIEPEEIVPENFDTLTSITCLVQAHLGT